MINPHMFKVTTLTLEEDGSRLCLSQVAEKDQVTTHCW